jgi:hypothetical protein
MRDPTILPKPTRVTITLSAPIYPRRAAKDDPNALQDIVRLRDEAREMIARHSGEPLL